MKKRKLSVKKIVMIIFICIIVVVFCYLQSIKSNEVRNSFKNSGYMGSSLFYDVLERLGYDVAYEIMPLNKLETNRLVLLNTVGKTLSKEDHEAINDYVKSGGNIFVVFGSNEDVERVKEPEGNFAVDENTTTVKKWVYNSDNVLIYGSMEDMMNVTVSIDTKRSYRLLKDIHPYIDNEGIVFNEYYLYVNNGQRSLWKEIPSGIKFIIYQVVIIAILIIWFKGKRFGAPTILYEETEPDENQYAKAVGELYYQAGHWETLLTSYYIRLLEKIRRKFYLMDHQQDSNWYQVWKVQVNKQNKMAEKVYSFMLNYNNGKIEWKSKKRKHTKIKQIIIYIQQLEAILDKP